MNTSAIMRNGTTKGSSIQIAGPKKTSRPMKVIRQLALVTALVNLIHLTYLIV
jgi:hypothetical protein